MRERVDILSRTQKTCLRLVAQGLTSKQIAIETGLSPHTVNKYLERATAVLHAENRRQAAQIFIKYEENGQFDEIEYDSKAVAAVPQRAIFDPSIDHFRSDGTGRQRGLRLFGFPPLGGERHELEPVETASTIVRIAVISAGGVAVLVTIGFWLMRLFV